MRKFINSLQTKLVISFVLLIVIIAGGTFWFTLGQTKKALLDTTREDVLQMVGIISSQFSQQDINTLVQLQPGQEQTAQYIALKTKMQNMRSLSPNIINIYTMRIENGKVTFVIDDLTNDFAAIGQQYEEPEAQLFKAVDGATASPKIYTDEWGTFLSGYAPLKDSTGTTQIIVGADMAAAQVRTRENFIGGTIYWIMGLGILIAAALVGIFSVTIIKDIKKLNKTAEEISKGNTNVSLDVVRRDEIGDLAESFGRMVASLKIMMSEGDDSPKT